MPLTLTSANYEPDYSVVSLTFNQDINTDEMVLEAIEVVDVQFTGQTFRGMTTTGLSSNSVTIEMSVIGTASGSGVKLNVASGNGIVAASDGAAWGGVSGLALPFP